MSCPRGHSLADVVLRNAIAFPYDFSRRARIRHCGTRRPLHESSLVLSSGEPSRRRDQGCTKNALEANQPAMSFQPAGKINACRRSMAGSAFFPRRIAGRRYSTQVSLALGATGTIRAPQISRTSLRRPRFVLQPYVERAEHLSGSNRRGRPVPGCVGGDASRSGRRKGCTDARPDSNTSSMLDGRCASARAI
jgi:hypothetical protein